MEKRKSKSELAISAVSEAAKAQKFDFFHDNQRRAWASVPVRTHKEIYAIRSRDFRLQIMKILYDAIGEAPRKLVNECIEHCETIAICGSPMLDVSVRVATSGDSVYVDLLDRDWQVIEISAAGWHILKTSPVMFRRTQGSAPLPFPRDGGKLQDLIQFMNVAPGQEALILAWLSYALAGRNAPFPILSLNGEQGSGKSMMTRVLRSLTDPNVAELTTAPSSERDLAIAASKSHVIAMDNLSEISAQLSDAMCRVATGGSFRTRELYTNDDEMIFCYRRPLVFNGIEELTIRADLLDRSLLIVLKQISQERRQDESLFLQRFEEARPSLFGALLETVVHGLRNIDEVNVPNLPRMADFCKWGVAVEKFLEFKEGSFLLAYRSNIADGNARALDSSPIAQAVYYFLKGDRSEFRGTALELLDALRQFIEDGSFSMTYAGRPKALKQLLRHPKFPKSPNQLSAELARIEPSLRSLGITFHRGQAHLGRFISLRRDDTIVMVQDEVHKEVRSERDDVTILRW